MRVVSAGGERYLKMHSKVSSGNSSIKWLSRSPNVSRCGCVARVGRQVEIDNLKAFELLQRAAELGNYGAQLETGWAYQEGIGVSASPRSACEWWQRAAVLQSRRERGVAFAFLGRCYLEPRGQGVEFDLAKAKQYLLLGGTRLELDWLEQVISYHRVNV